MLRLTMWYGLKESLNQVLVSEFPKSGGSWLCQMLSEALEIPFPRNKRPIFDECILHGHHLYHFRFGKMIGVIRDGRDVMVSAYFYFLFENERNPELLVKRFRSEFPFTNYSDIHKNLPEFIRYMFEDYSERLFHFTWMESIHSFYNNKNVKIVKYEKLLLDPIKELKETIAFLEKEIPSETVLSNIIDKYSFKRMTKREPGEEDRTSFLRKGIAGDWRNYFSKEACITFADYAGEALIKAGYELDQAWVETNNKE